MARYTRGPWTLVGYPADKDWDGLRYDMMQIDDDGGWLLCELRLDDDDDEMVGNLRLMAAAPDLLAACEAIATLRTECANAQVRGDDPGYMMTVVKMGKLAQDAVKKARGER